MENMENMEINYGRYRKNKYKYERERPISVAVDLGA